MRYPRLVIPTIAAAALVLAAAAESHAALPRPVGDKGSGNKEKRPKHDRELKWASGIEQVDQNTAGLGLEAYPEGEVEEEASDEERNKEKRET